MLPLAGITEWLGLEWSGPDWTLPSGGQALTVFVVFNVVSLGLTALVADWAIRELPTDHFTADRSAADASRPRRGPLRWLAANAAGLVSLALGLFFLLTPGQGAFLILIGLVLLDLPPLRRYERKLAGWPKVMAALNWVRRRHDQPPFEPPLPDPDPWLTGRQKAGFIAGIVILTVVIGRWVYVAYR